MNSRSSNRIVGKKVTKRRGRRVRKRALAVLLLLIAAAVAGLYIWQWQKYRFPCGIVIHHSASPMSSNGKLIGAAEIATWHEQRGFAINYEGQTYNIGYHYVILADGTVQPGRPEECRGSHATNGNDSLGICIVGNFSSRDNPRGEKGPNRPTKEQMEALEPLCRDLMRRHRLKVSSVRTHAEVDGDTECPGDLFPFDTLLSDLANHQN